MNRKLFDIATLNLSDLSFSEPETKSIPGQKLSYQRLRLSLLENGKHFDCLFRSPPSLLSWGIQESRDPATDELTGFQMPIVMWTNNGNEAERAFTDGFDRFCEHVKQQLLEKKATFGKYDLELSELKRLNPMYWKMEKGKVVDESKGPTLYGKCLYDRKSQKIGTMFVNELTKQIVPPESLIGKHLYVTFTLRVDGVFIGNRLSLQIRIAEVLFREKQQHQSSLLCPEAVMSTMEEYDETEEETDESEMEGSESEESVDAPIPVQKSGPKEIPVVRRSRSRVVSFT